MTKRKEEIKEVAQENWIDSIWLFTLLLLLFPVESKPKKVINIYMGDDVDV